MNTYSILLRKVGTEETLERTITAKSGESAISTALEMAGQELGEWRVSRVDKVGG